MSALTETSSAKRPQFGGAKLGPSTGNGAGRPATFGYSQSHPVRRRCSVLLIVLVFKSWVSDSTERLSDQAALARRAAAGISPPRAGAPAAFPKSLRAVPLSVSALVGAGHDPGDAAWGQEEAASIERPYYLRRLRSHASLISKATIVTMVVTTIGPANIATSVSIFSVRRLEAGSGKPFQHMRNCLGLLGLANEIIAHNPRWCALGLFAQALCLLRQTLIEWGVFFEPASLHGAAPSEEAGAQPAFSSPMEATGRAVMGQSAMSDPRQTGQYSSRREIINNSILLRRSTGT